MMMPAFSDTNRYSIFLFVPMGQRSPRQLISGPMFRTGSRTYMLPLAGQGDLLKSFSLPTCCPYGAKTWKTGTFSVHRLFDPL